MRLSLLLYRNFLWRRVASSVGMSRNTYFSPFDDNAFDYINDFEIFDRPATTVRPFHVLIRWLYATA